MRITRTVAAALGMLLVAGAFIPVTAADSGDNPGRYRANGDPGGFLNILPPGQDGVANGPEAIAAQGGQYPEHFRDQLGMYEELVYDDATPGIGYDQLPDYFKDASFGVAPDDLGDTSSCPSSVETQVGTSTPPACYRPGGRDDVVVYRDSSFGVPHIFGDTREGAMFAAGYTGAEDRLFLMDVLRHVGRAELAAFLGASEANKRMDREQLAVAPYTEEDLTEQVDNLRQASPGVVSDADAYLAGINAYIAEALVNNSKLPAEYPALQQLPEEFVAEDIVAIASLVGGIFGKGGGGEVRNFCGLETLSSRLGSAEEARAVFDDFKFRDDPEAPATTTRSFPYMSDLGQVEEGAVPALDCDSVQAITAPPPDPADAPGTVEDLVPVPPLPPASAATVDGPFGPLLLDADMSMSNALLIGSEHTPSGVPVAVFGPQTSYYVPQLLVEKDIHGPGIDARGVSFAGTDLYVQLGRGRDYAWSATSAGGDLVDERVLELCEPGGGEPTVESMGYVYRGECREIEAHSEVLVAKPSAGGIPVGEEDPPEQDDVLINKYFERAPDYGPLTARGTLSDGTPVAIATQRTTYFSELASARGFRQINDPEFMAEGYESFRRAFGDGVDYTFNWFYVDREHIGYQVSCRCPQRPDGVDPYLPTWGNGEWDWQGNLDREALPHALDPEDGYLISWNNKQAPGWWSHDRQFGWGPIHRSSLLERRVREHLEADGAISRTEGVDIMELAGTTDLRAQELVDLLALVMGPSAPDGADPRAQRMLERMRAWAQDDHGHRRDHDGDGTYEHAVAIAVMDAWWQPLVDAMFEQRSGNAREALGIGLHNSPHDHIGSAFQDSLYAHVQKDLRQVLDGDVVAPFHRTYCGGGDLAACRSALWDSLSSAAADLEEEFGSSDIEDWTRDPSYDEIRHTAVGVLSVRPIHWVNRPTFQQVVEVGAPLDAPLEDMPAPGDDGSTDAQRPARDNRSLPATGGGGGPGLAVGLALIALAVGLARRWRRAAS